jgi:hypothetical protein
LIVLAMKVPPAWLPTLKSRNLRRSSGFKSIHG